MLSDSGKDTAVSAAGLREDIARRGVEEGAPSSMNNIILDVWYLTGPCLYTNNTVYPCFFRAALFGLKYVRYVGMFFGG